jgi:hypothetical protein
LYDGPDVKAFCRRQTSIFAITALTITAKPTTDARTAQVQRLNHIQSLKNLKAELDKHTFLRDRYIVFPNVTNEGEFSLLRKGLAGKYAEMPFSLRALPAVFIDENAVSNFR